MKHSEANALKRNVRKLLRENSFVGHSFDRTTVQMAGVVVASNMVKDESPRGAIVYFLGYDPLTTSRLLHQAQSILKSNGFQAHTHRHNPYHPTYLHVYPAKKGAPSDAD